MEIIIIVLLSVAVGYWRGVVSGYELREREGDTSKIFNVDVIEENNQAFFYDLKLNRFMFQCASVQEGIDRLKQQLPEGTVIVVSRS